jgi:hypothetical protein
MDREDLIKIAEEQLVKKFYADIVAKQTEQIVLKKKKSAMFSIFHCCKKCKIKFL